MCLKSTPCLSNGHVFSFAKNADTPFVAIYAPFSLILLNFSFIFHTIFTYLLLELCDECANPVSTTSSLLTNIPFDGTGRVISYESPTAATFTSVGVLHRNPFSSYVLSYSW
jgi:hypothetical protein